MNKDITEEKKSWPGKTASALRKVVTADGTAVFEDVDKLSSGLSKRGLPVTEIKKIELVLSDDDIRDFMVHRAGEATFVEINGILMSIMTRCGLGENSARTLLDELLYSVQAEYTVSDYSELKALAAEGAKDKYIPRHLYQRKLRDIYNKIRDKHYDLITLAVTEELNVYANCGIGFANYIIAVMYYEGISVPKDLDKSIEYAEKAAAMGCAEAYVLLGNDSYLDNKYDDAYSYFSKPGALSVDKTTKERVENLFAAKEYARKLCMITGILAIIMVLSMFFIVSPMALVGSKTVLPVVFSAIIAVTMAAMLFHNFKKKFADLRFYMVILMLLYSVYLIIALI